MACGANVKMTNVDEILNYKRKEEEDYYAILGCDEDSTVGGSRLGTARMLRVVLLAGRADHDGVQGPGAAAASG